MQRTQISYNLTQVVVALIVVVIGFYFGRIASLGSLTLPTPTPSPTASRTQALSKADEETTDNDRETVLSYLVQNSSELSVAIPHVATDLYSESPGQARDFLLRLSPDDQASAMFALGRLAEAANRNDGDDGNRSPEAMASWMLEFPAEVWMSGIVIVLEQWELKDAPNLYRWMVQLPTEMEQKMIEQYPFGSANDQKLQTITASASALRDQLLEEVMRRGQYSRAAAITALQKLNLPPAQQVYLVSLIPKQDQEE